MAKKITKKMIVAAVKAATGLEDVGLHKLEGFYYWDGKASYCFEGESNTWYTELNDPKVPLERWVEDFKWKVKETEEANWDNRTMQQIIDNINWDIDSVDKEPPQVIKISYTKKIC